MTETKKPASEGRFVNATVRLPKDLHTELLQISRDTGIVMSDLILFALWEAVHSYPSK